MPGFATKLSSAGLIYKHYGREVVAKLMEKADVDADVECVYLAVYKNFMEAIDAVDNGRQSIDCLSMSVSQGLAC